MGEPARAEATGKIDSKHKDVKKKGRSQRQISQENHFYDSVPCKKGLYQQAQIFWIGSRVAEHAPI